MLWQLLAGTVVLLHASFAVFVVLGGLLVLRHRRVAPFHLAAAAWGAWIELSGWVCPLTPLENALRLRAGGTAYAGDFIAHYLLRALYPEELTRQTQIALGLLVVAVNCVVYAFAMRRRRR